MVTLTHTHTHNTHVYCNKCVDHDTRAVFYFPEPVADLEKYKGGMAGLGWSQLAGGPMV